MPASTAINLHIERVIIDEAVHRAGPEAVRAALAAQLPALLAAGTCGTATDGVLPQMTADRVAERVSSTNSPRTP